MEINQTNMANLFKSFSAVFNGAVAQAGQGMPNDIKQDELCMIIPSTGSATTHSWMQQLPGMEKWVGTRTVKKLGVNALTAINEDFADAVAVPANAIEDDSYGTFTPLMAALGSAAGALWLEIGIAALLANDNWADGKPFFGSGRVLETGAKPLTNAVTTELSVAAIEAAIASIRSQTLEAGKPAKVTPKILLVGPGLEATAKRIVESELVSTAEGGTETNIHKGILQLRVSAELIDDHAKKWFILSEKNTIKAVAVQKRKEGSLVARDKPTDDNVFEKNEFQYGVHYRGTAFLTMPHLAYCGGMTTVPSAAPAK